MNHTDWTGRAVPPTLSSPGSEGRDRFALLECLYEIAGGRSSVQVSLATAFRRLEMPAERGSALARWLVMHGLLRQSFGPAHADLTGIAIDFVEAARNIVSAGSEAAVEFHF